MSSRRYWIDLNFESAGRLAILARPLGADRLKEEIQAWSMAGINVVISLLADTEINELELEVEGALCKESGIEFHRFPIEDRGVPDSRREVIEFVEIVRGRIAAGRRVGIHCRAGIGRSGLMAACVLSRMGHDVNSAFERIKQARGVEVPDTPEQCEWVRSFIERA